MKKIKNHFLCIILLMGKKTQAQLYNSNQVLQTLENDDNCDTLGTAFDSNESYGDCANHVVGALTNSILKVQGQTSPKTCLDFYVPFISFMDYCSIANEFRLYFDQRVSLETGEGTLGRFKEVTMVKFMDSWT